VRTPTMKTRLGTFLRGRRTALDLSQHQLSERLGWREERLAAELDSTLSDLLLAVGFLDKALVHDVCTRLGDQSEQAMCSALHRLFWCIRTAARKCDLPWRSKRRLASTTGPIGQHALEGRRARCEDRNLQWWSCWGQRNVRDWRGWSAHIGRPSGLRWVLGSCWRQPKDRTVPRLRGRCQLPLDDLHAYCGRLDR
jgi:hypothetical protein